jgi:hypothetical protein
MKKDTSNATLALVFSILTALPLLGLFAGALGVTFGITSLKSIKREPKKYGGKKRAIAALTIVGAFLIMWTWALIFHPQQLFPGLFD